MMHSSEYEALMKERQAMIAERRGIHEEWRLRTATMHSLEGMMWRTLALPGGTEPHQAWRAAVEHRDELVPMLGDLDRRASELSAKMKVLLEADGALPA